MERCFFCQGKLENSFVGYKIENNAQTIVIKNIPCHKCLQCGEISFSGEVADYIDKINKTAKNNERSQIFLFCLGAVNL